MTALAKRLLCLRLDSAAPYGSQATDTLLSKKIQNRRTIVNDVPELHGLTFADQSVQKGVRALFRIFRVAANIDRGSDCACRKRKRQKLQCLRHFCRRGLQ